MDKTRRRIITTASLGLMPVQSLLAQNRQKPLTLVVGFPPGGSGDTVARAMGHQFEQRHRRTVIVDNRPGAGGRIALQHVKRSEPSGDYLIQVPISTMAIYPHVYSNLEYDPLADFVAVARIARFPFAFCVGPSVPNSIDTLAKFGAWCTANPEKANFGSPGEGTMAHFAGFMIARAAGFKMTHVAYRGSAPALQDLLGGHIPASIHIPSEVLPYVAEGRLRALVTTGATRAAQLPDVRNMQEEGFPGVVAEEYFAVFAPAGTPSSVTEPLSRQIADAVASPSVTDQLAKLGFEVSPSDGPTLAALLREDLARWGPVVKATGFTAT